jgi:hypothetical protein
VPTKDPGWYHKHTELITGIPAISISERGQWEREMGFTLSNPSQNRSKCPLLFVVTSGKGLRDGGGEIERSKNKRW